MNVAFSNPKSQTYVSLSGRAELVRDRAKLEELWKPELKAWFPKGLDEPDIALLRINPDQGEYWDTPSSIVSHALSFIKGVTSGNPAQSTKNEKVDL